MRLADRQNDVVQRQLVRLGRLRRSGQPGLAGQGPDADDAAGRPVLRPTPPRHTAIAHRVLGHARGQALLEAAVLAPVPVEANHQALAVP